MSARDKYLHNRRVLAVRLHSQYFGTYDYAEAGQCAIAAAEITDLLKCVHPASILTRWAQVSSQPAAEAQLADHARLCSEYWHALSTATQAPVMEKGKA